MNNTVQYTVDLTPENAGKIDQINKILLGGDYVESQPCSAGVQSEPQGHRAEATTQEATKDTSAEPTLDDLKHAIQKARTELKDKDAHAQEVLNQLGVKAMERVGMRYKHLEPEKFAEFLSLMAAGPQEDDGLGGDDDLGEDDLGGDDGLGGDAPAIDPEAVKIALRAKAKAGDRDGAKALLVKHKLANLAAIDVATPEVLSALMADLA